MTSNIVPALPEIIQGGMGVHISHWQLAKYVSQHGALGTVSGTALDRVMARILARGDIDGHFRRALSHFPFPEIARQVLDAYFFDRSDPERPSPKNVPFFTINPPDILISLCIVANFAFVYLAKEGHNYPVSINYLEKIAIPHIYAITGAMLAGVDYITMGAGIPLQIPEVIDSIASGRIVKYQIPVAGTNIKNHTMTFHPESFLGGRLPPLRKPGFIPIIASNTLGQFLKKSLAEGAISGFVIEEPTAGGHNAPPRKNGIYGPKDEVDYYEIGKLGLPFWIGGSKASPEKMAWAKSVGARGIQAGTIFGLCHNSGMYPPIRHMIRNLGFKGMTKVKTDMTASPTGYPFKVVTMPETLSEESVYLSRERVCSQGALRTLYEKSDGTIGYRCPAESVASYGEKLGCCADAIGRRCICNGLLSTAGLGDPGEPPIVTLGDDVSFLKRIISHPDDSYGVVEALEYLRS